MTFIRLVNMKKIKALLMVLLLVSIFVPMRPVHADVAPPPAPGLGGLRPLQYQSTEVQMLYERVEMTLNPLPPQSDYGVEDKVDVTAWFVLRNTGSRDEEMK